MHTQALHSQDEGLGQSTPCGFSHIAIPSRDLVQSKRFFVEVLGVSLASDGPALAPVQCGDFGIVLGLASYDIPTSEIWSRNGSDAAIYFRDPSGNLWELYCESCLKGAVRRGVSAGSDYAPSVKSLNYAKWKEASRGVCRDGKYLRNFFSC